MSQEGMFVVVLTVQRGSGRLLTSPDIISRGFIYLRDSEELMNLIRQYLKQKAQRSFGGRKVDMETLKKEIKDEVTHLLYDQTRRTPIVIPVINEIGGNGGGNSGGNAQNGRGGNNNKQQGNNRQNQNGDKPFVAPAAKKFPPKQVPDTETVEPKAKPSTQSY